MKLPNNVKPFPRFKSPLNRAENGFVSYSGKTIYLSSQIYNNLLSKNPKPFSVSVLKHEEEHVRQIKRIGAIKLILKNTFSFSSRLQFELEAYKNGFEYLKKHHETIDLDRIARNLSGLKYYYATNYKNAKKLLDKAWEEV